MKGTIRTAVGFLMVAGAVGGMETGTDAQLPIQLFVALVGLAIAYSGVRQLKKAQ